MSDLMKENERRAGMGLPPIRVERKPTSQYTVEEIEDYLKDVRSAGSKLYSEQADIDAYVEKVKKRVLEEVAYARKKEKNRKPRKKAKIESSDSILVVDESTGEINRVPSSEQKPEEAKKIEESIRERMAVSSTRSGTTFKDRFSSISKLFKMFETKQGDEKKEKVRQSEELRKQVEQNKNVGIALEALSREQEITVKLLRELLDAVKDSKRSAPNPRDPASMLGSGQQNEGRNISLSSILFGGMAAGFGVGILSSVIGDPNREAFADRIEGAQQASDQRAQEAMDQGAGGPAVQQQRSRGEFNESIRGLVRSGQIDREQANEIARRVFSEEISVERGFAEIQMAIQQNENRPEETEDQIYQRLLSQTPENMRNDVNVQNDLRTESGLIYQNNRIQRSVREQQPQSQPQQQQINPAESTAPGTAPAQQIQPATPVATGVVPPPEPASQTTTPPAVQPAATSTAPVATPVSTPPETTAEASAVGASSVIMQQFMPATQTTAPVATANVQTPPPVEPAATVESVTPAAPIPPAAPAAVQPTPITSPPATPAAASSATTEPPAAAAAMTTPPAAVASPSPPATTTAQEATQPATVVQQTPVSQRTSAGRNIPVNEADLAPREDAPNVERDVAQIAGQLTLERYSQNLETLRQSQTYLQANAAGRSVLEQNAMREAREFGLAESRRMQQVSQEYERERVAPEIVPIESDTAGLATPASYRGLVDEDQPQNDAVPVYDDVKETPKNKEAVISEAITKQEILSKELENRPDMFSNRNLMIRARSVKFKGDEIEFQQPDAIPHALEGAGGSGGGASLEHMFGGGGASGGGGSAGGAVGGSGGGGSAGGGAATGGGAAGAPQLTSIRTKSGKSVQVAASVADRFQGFLNDLEATGYQIREIGGYANRVNVNNPSVMSTHASGLSIDINPAENPNRSRRTDMPPETAQLAAKWGLGWGMNWRSVQDPMHFSAAANEGGTTPRPDATQVTPQSGGSGGGAEAAGGDGAPAGGGGTSDAAPSAPSGGDATPVPSGGGGGAAETPAPAATPVSPEGGEGAGSGEPPATPAAPATPEPGGESPSVPVATPEPRAPTTGIEVAQASTENEMAARIPEPPSVTQVSADAGGATEPMQNPSYSHSVNDPGPVEPADAAQRYAQLFNMAA